MSDVDVTLTEYTVEVVDNIDETTIILSGSTVSNVYITDASELTTSHIENVNNPHEVTAEQVGLGNVINAEQLLASQLEDTLTPTASGSVPSSKAVADYVAIASPVPTAETIVTLINASAEVIADANIAASIARDTEVSNAISQATASLVNTNDSRLSDARTPTAHTQAASTITDFNTEVSNNTDVAANTSARHTHANAAVLNAISGSGSGEIITVAERAKLAAIEAGATGDLSASEIITLINNSDGIIDDNNIASTLSRTSHNHSGTYEPAFSKNTAFNKNFGNTSGTVTQGNDSRLSDARTPLAHTQAASTITDFDTEVSNNIDVAANTSARHSHTNSSILSSITDAGSGVIISTAERNKLSGIEAGATADMSASEIVSLINASAQVIDDDNIANTLSRTSHNHSGIYEPIISTKKTAFNVDFGTESGTACQGNDSRLSNSRTPTSHGNEAHSSTFITASDVHSNANDPSSGEKEALAGTSGTPSSTNKYVTNADSRMSDARTPTSHSHTYSDISSVVTTVTDDDTKIPTAGAIVDYVAGLGGGDMLKSTYDTDNDGKVNAAVNADAVPWSGVSSKPSTYPPDAHNHDTVYEPIISTKKTAFNVDFGSTVGTACQGNDSRLSDARTPASHGNEAHSSTFITAGDVHSNANDPSSTEKEALAGTSGTPSSTNKYVTNGDSRMSDARTPTSHAHGSITNAGAIGTTENLPIITTTGGALTVGSFGSSANTFCQGNDSRLSDSRTPTSHTHGNITNTGYLGSTANIPLITGTDGVIQAGSFGTGATDFAAGNHAHSGTYEPAFSKNTAFNKNFGSSAGDVCQGNDSRLSDSRTPTSHSNTAHSETYITTAGVTYEALTGNSDVGTGSSQVAAGNHTHGNITSTGYLGSTAAIPLITGTDGVIQAGQFGNSAGQFCQGNDSRLSDARTPTSHAHGNITNAGAIGSTANLPVITTTSGVLTVGSFGSSANTFCVGNDSRLSDSRTPTSHNNSAHSETYITAAGVTYEQLNSNGDVGSSSGTLCAGDDSRLVTNAKQADRPFVFQTGHTAWATGLSNEEIGRIQLQTGETLYIKRVEIQIKGGGTSSSLSVNAYDSTNTTQIASQTAGGVNTTGGNSGAAALVLIRLTNSVGSTQSASVYISGWIRS